jgi:uncharacterized damage-inducible protein DinB
MNESIIRDQLAKLQDWSDAHINIDGAISGVPVEMRGSKVAGFPHSLWELLEHIRRAQWDILDFCRNAAYKELPWPEAYWPETPTPPTPEAWDESIANYERDRAELQALATATSVDPTATIPHGSGQTYLRELILVADHTSYHVGQIVMLRRMLGIWRAD